MALPFQSEEAGDTIHLSGVILNDYKNNREYTCYLPQMLEPGFSTETYQFNADDWDEWLKHSDDPTFTEYTDETRKVVKAVVRKGTRQVIQDVVWATYRRDNFACRYCGTKNLPLTYDHYVAQAFGGLWTLENGRTACRPCNKKKANKTVAEWEEEMKKWKTKESLNVAP
jgi:5-methylcytosine-specific restriction endonuclease McrA